jgi:hypothetical protein
MTMADSAALHWLDMSLEPACAERGPGTVVKRLVSCEACKVSASYLAVAGGPELQAVSRG